jgi:hypothetical protein
MPGEPLIVEGIADLLSEMTDIGPPQLLVRVYPKDRTNRFADLQGRRRDILFPSIPWERAWFTPKLEDAYLLTNMLRHADVGINIASTVSLELCIFDRPVINIAYGPQGKASSNGAGFLGYYDFEHYRPLTQSGAITLARSEIEAEAMLRRALTDPGANSARRRVLIDSMFDDNLDGRSGQRVANALLQIAKAGCTKRRSPGGAKA